VIGVVARASVTRLVRARRPWLAPLAWLVLALGFAALTRVRGAAHGADDVLPGMIGAFVVPLLAYAAVTAVVGDGGVRGVSRGFVAVGAAPLHAALGSALVATGLAAITGALATGLVALIAHGSADPPLVLDLPLSALVGALGGAAYGALFCAGASFGAGALRGGLLAADFVLGSEGSPLAWLFPRAHLLALLGGVPALDLPRRASSVALVVLAGLYLAVVLLASRRPR
jgi:hypothetical protein